MYGTMTKVLLALILIYFNIILDLKLNFLLLILNDFIMSLRCLFFLLNFVLIAFFMQMVTLQVFLNSGNNGIPK